MRCKSLIKIQKWYRKKLYNKKEKIKLKAIIYIQKYYRKYNKHKQKLVNINKKLSNKINNLEKINEDRKNYIYQVNNELSYLKSILKSNYSLI